MKSNGRATRAPRHLRAAGPAEATSPFWRPIKYALFPPLGLATLAAYLTPEDHALLVDEHVEKLRIDDTPAPDLVVIQVYITNAYRAYRLADRYRVRGVFVALGGLHVTSLPAEAAAHADAILWYAFFDDPTTHPDGTGHVQSTLQLRGAIARSVGERVEIVFELYAHMNINYIRLDRLPAFDRSGDALAPLAKGEFFTTTGEVVLPEVDLTSSSAAEIVATVRALWTFPLRFAEIVWGDGQATHREVIELADTREFGSKRFGWRAKASGWKWALVAVWDVAGNGAFVNPFWRP